jgi:hypothetical protein
MIQDAFNCVAAHKASGNNQVQNASSQDLPLVMPENNIEEYHRDVLESGTLEAAKRLCLSLIEDYEITRTKELQEKGKVGPLSLNFGKNAAEALGAYNKLCYGEKSAHLSVSVDGKKKSDLDAIRQILSNNNQTPINMTMEDENSDGED